MALQNTVSFGLSAAVPTSATDCTLDTDTRKCLAVIFVSSGFGGLEVACWPLVPKWSRGSVLAFGTQVV